MKQIYLTKKINELVSTILILLGLKKESIGLSTTSTSKPLINFDSRNSFGLYSFKAALVLLFFVFGLGNNVRAQSTANYAFTTNATGSLAADDNSNTIDMTTGTTSLLSTGIDDTSSTLTNFNLGTGASFDFYFMGARYTQFSVSDNGIISLGATTTTSAYALPNGTVPTISAFANDMKTGTTGGVTAKIVGTAPNRTLVIQWNLNMIRYLSTSGVGGGTWQVRLYESSGAIQFVYGAMTTNTATPSVYYVGFSNNSTVNNVVTVNTTANTASTSATVTSNAYTASSTITALNSAANGSRRTYKFTPAAPAAPTGLTFSGIGVTTTTVNWTAASPTTGILKYAVYYSTDGGTTYTFLNTTALGTNTLAVTGLTAGTTYTYLVYAINEGGKSTNLTGSQATTALSPMTGTYTINNTLATTSPIVHNGTSNFASFTDAINYMNINGVSGPVTINVTAGQTFAELTPVITATGTSVNTITFQKSGSGNNPKITPTGVGTTDAGITIGGGDYFTFDGIDVDASAATTSTNAIEYGYYVRNASATNGAQFNTIKNCAITLNKNFISSSTSGCIYSNVATAASAATGANSNNKYYNLTLSNAQNGVYLVGTAAFPDLATEVGVTGSGCQTSRNAISNMGGVFTIATAYGIYASNQSGAKIFNNNISAITGNQTATGAAGINFLGGLLNSEIYNNNIQNISVTGSTTTVYPAYGMNVQLAIAGTNNVRIYNNFISNIYTSYTTAGGVVTLGAYGLFTGIASATASQSYDIDNNNISIGQGLTPTYTNTCFWIQNSTPIYRVHGNIFANFSGAQGATAKHTCITATAAAIGGTGTAFDYNDYYIATDQGTSGHVGRISTTNYNALTDWQTFTTGTLDDTSKTVNPIFTNANTDLSASNSSLIIASGFTPATWVTSDIFCNVRSTYTSPVIGANAFNPPASPTITNLSLLDLCVTGGQTVTITGTNFTGITSVQFNGLAAASYTVVSATSITAVTPANVTNGFVTVTNSAGSGTSSGSYTPQPTPATPTVSGGGTVCTSTTLTAANGSDGTMYWQNTTVAGVSTATPSSSQLVSAAGTYVFRAQSSYGCWSAAGTAAVVINTPITITTNVVTTAQTKCLGVAATALSVVAAGTTPTYQWYSNTVNDTVSGTAVSGATSASYTPLTTTAGTTYYYCIVSSVAPCSSAVTSAVATINVNALPTISGSTAACVGQTMQLTGSGTADATTPWVSGSTSVATISTTGLVTGVVAGSSVITYKDGNGCSNTQAITVNVTPSAVTAASTKTTMCVGGSLNLSATGGTVTATTNEGFDSAASLTTNGWTFVNAGTGNPWAVTTSSSYYRNGPGAIQCYYNSTNAANAWAFSPARSLTAGVTYTITYWYMTGGFSENLKLTVGTLNTVAGQTTTLLTQAGILNTTYTQASVTYTPASSGTYYFALNCYSAANEFYLNVDDFAITSPAPATYAWTSVPSGFTSSSQNVSGVAPTVSTTYTISATIGSCTTTSSVAVTVNALPTVVVDTPTANICTGGSGVTINASGAATYAWTPSLGLNGTTSSTVVANPTSTTTYTVTGTTNNCTASATAVVTLNTPVSISGQPGNQIVLENDPASFTVTATGSGLTYLWQVNDGSGWADLTTATSATYAIASAAASLNGYLYRCVVTGTCGTLTSGNATLSVGSVSITTHPVAQTICSNASATYAVTTSGDVSSYQWQVSTNGTTWTNVTGATAASLVLSGLTSANTGAQYRCQLNGGAVTSNAALLTVYDAIVIGTQPTSQTVCSNVASVTFTAAASGSGLAYQWQMSTNGGTSWNNVSAATSATYTINTPGVALNNNQYRVIASGTSPCSALTSDVATLTVNQLVAITTQPTAVTQCPSVATAAFTVAATGTGLTYQWQYSTNGTTWNDYSDATASTLTITSPSSFNGNSFRCVVGGATSCSSVTSNAVVLTITPSFGGTYTVGAGGNYATLTAAVAAYNAATCFSGNVVFSLTDASYSASETFPITVNANSNAGSNTLTIVPASGNTATITGSNATAIIKLNGADNVIIDGSNNGTTSRNLTIANTNASTSSAILWLASVLSPLNGATNNTIKNTNLTGNTSTWAGAMASAATIGNVADAPNTGNTYQNNAITGSYYGIALAGATAGESNNSVLNNTIGSSVTANKIGYEGVFSLNQNNVTIKGNTILGVSNAGSTTTSIAGIFVSGIASNGEVSNNVISDIKCTSARSVYGIQLGSSTATSGLTIANNMIFDVNCSNTNASLTRGGHGMAILTGGGYKIYNNTINLNTSNAASTATGISAALYVASGVTGLDVRNNIFANQQPSTTRYAIYDATATNAAYTTINYNNYSSAGTALGYLASARTALADIVTGFGQNANSTAVTPSFISATNAHLALGSNITLDNTGTPIAAITTDIDGDARSATTPDMGADEFTTLYCATASAGTLATTAASLCTTGSATISATGFSIGLGTTYQWQSATDNAFTTPVNVGTTAATTYANLATGTITTTTYYRLGVTCNAGSTVYSTPIAVVVNTPATITPSAAVTICTGQTTTLTATGGATYTWSPATGLSATTGSSVNANPTATTTYTVNGVDANGCTMTAKTIAVTVNAYPNAVTITQGAASVCTDSVMSLTATGGLIVNSIPTASQYVVTPSSGTFTALTGGTTVTGLNADTAISAALPIGFSFSYAGNTYTNVYADSNGLLTFNSSASSTTTNNLTSPSTSIVPFIAPLWDDLDGASVGAASYLTSGTAGNRVFTFEWLNWEWGYLANAATVSFQVKLYEADGKIEFIYRADGASTSSPSASVGLATSVGNYVSLGSLGTSPTTSTTSETTSISTKPATGQMYTFTRPSTPTTLVWSPTTDLYTTSGATTAYAGGNASVVYTKPSAERVYTVTASNGSCSVSNTTTVTPIAKPDFTLTDVTICKGQSTTLAAIGTGYTYVWSPSLGLNGTTGASVTANPTATTTYTVVATDAASGCTATKNVVVTVSEPGAILTVGTTSTQIAVPGGSTTFHVATASGTTYTYQWQVNDGSGWVNVSNNSYYSDGTTATLTISNIESTFDNYQYHCLVTGAAPCATLTSNAAILTVSSTGIAQQPASVTLCGTTSTAFTIVTNGDDPYGITWQMSVNNGAFADLADGTDATTGLTFSGVDQPTLNVSGITVANSGVKFLCVLNYYLNSDAATLLVKNPVVIGTQPTDQTVCSTGGTATFTAAATGDDLAYQWQFSTNGTTWSNYTGTGATTASISIVNPAVATEGTQYKVIVSGNAACGSVTSSVATLHINNPTITSQPTAATILRGNTATFTVAASAATSYQWQRSTTLAGTYANVVDATPVGDTYSGATTASLSVVTSATTVTGGGNYYRCVVTNNGCTVTSTGALLTVNDYCTPAVTTTTYYITGVTTTGGLTNISNSTTAGLSSGYSNYYATNSVSQYAGFPVNYSVSLYGNSTSNSYSYGVAIWVDWNSNGTFETSERMYNSAAYIYSASGSFTVPANTALGSYRMRVVADYNNTSPSACTVTTGEVEDYKLIVSPIPSCNGTPTAGTASVPSTLACAGSGTTITLTGSTTGFTGISYQWYYSANGTTYAPVSGATTTSLNTGVLTADAHYYCTVTCTNSGLSANSNTVDLSYFNPQITSTTPAGRCGTGTLALSATANAGSTINWFTAATGGSPLATGGSFTTPSLSATTTYYAEASVGQTTVSGLGNTDAGPFDTTGASSERGIVFTATASGTIVSAQYYSPTLNVTNTVTVRLVNNATGTQIGSSLSLPISQVAEGFYTMNLNLPVTAGTTYQLLASFTQSVNRIATGVDYSSSAFNNLAPIGTIISGYDGAASSTTYSYFHNIVVQTAGCSSRTAVVATVDALPTATISYAGSPFCTTLTTGAVTRTGTTGGTYSSTTGLTIDPATGAVNPSTSTPGTYTVTYAMAATTYCTAQTATATVVINQAPVSAFTYNATTYCTNGGTVTPILTGSAGTFSVTSTPSTGLSINATTGVITLASSTAGTYTVRNRVIVAGCATSNTSVTVTINNAVAITTQPISVSKLPGDNTSFTVAATGTGLTYQWQVNDGTGFVNVSGATTATLALTGVTTGMTGYLYQVIVSGATACSSVTSTPATLTVNTAAIANQPANYTACSEGANTATFSVTTTGTVDTYQWQFSTNGTTWLDINATNWTSASAYATADTASLSLSGLSLPDNALQFRCVLNSVVNSNAATLTIKTAVAITTQPSSTTGCSAGSATFTAAASGSGVSYQWQVSTNGTTWTNVSGATAATLTVSSLTTAMNGNQYHVVVSGASPCSPLTSSAATLSINAAIAITTQPSSTTVCNATNASFSVTATGASPTYQWEVSTNGTTYTPISGETASSLTVNAVTVAMSGYKYHVVISGAAPCGVVTSSAATLTVSQPAAPIISPVSADVCTNAIQALTVTNPLVGNVVVGTGTTLNSTTGYPSPYSNYYGGTKHQMLIKASELSALGLVAGANISSIAFNVSGVGSTFTGSLSNFQISMKNTTTSVLTSTSFESGLTLVYGPVTQAIPITGLPTSVTHTLTSPFAWNGTSNVIVETSYSNANSGTSTDYVTMTSSDPGFVSTNYYRADSVSATAILAATTPSGSGNARPNMVLKFGAGTTTWSPTTGLYTNAGATTAYTSGTNAAVVYVKTASSTIYTVTSTSTLGCTNTATVGINVLTPATLSSVTQPAITCSGAQTTFNLTGLLASSTSTVSYTINGGTTQTVTGVVADASGNASFTLTLAGFTNGQTLTITSIQRTDLTPSCTTAITANNTVVIAVRPLVTYYVDADGDGYGNFNNAVTTCQGQPSGYITNGTDCDDTNALVYRTGTLYVDADADGYDNGTQSICYGATVPSGYSATTNGADCNDTNAAMHTTFTFYADTDGDTYGSGSGLSICAVDAATAPTGYSVNNTDCAPSDAAIHATYPFYADTDADGYGAGAVVSLCSVDGATAPTGYVVNNTDCNDADATMHATFTFYADTDADGYGAGSAVSLCSVDAATAPTGYSVNATDCNDASATVHATASYYVDVDADGYDNGTATLCAATAPTGYSATTNGSDCNDNDASLHSTATYYVDADHDGFGSTTTAQLCSATATVGYSTNNTDCNDSDATAHATATYYVDVDADGYDNGRVILCAASAPVGYSASTNGSDCNDNDATVHYAITYYVDADHDGFGSTATAEVCSATATTGYSVNNTDCNDTDASAHATASYYVDADGDGFDAGSATLCAATAPSGYSATTSGTDCNDTVYSATNTCSSIVNLKLNIQGYYDVATHAMRPVLANQGVGTSTTDVDDVTVELRDSSSNALVASVTARLHTDGTATATFGTAPIGSFYIAVKHRNSLETWSSAPQTVGATPLTYDFTTAANKAYGDNMIQLESGVYGFYSGDINQDGFIEFLDYPQLFNDSDNLLEGYQTTDLNGDGFVEFLDYPILFNNSDNLIETLHP